MKTAAEKLRSYLDKDVYQEAAKLGVTVSEFLDWKAQSASAGEQGAFDWYNPNLTTADGRKLDAFEQALLQLGIKVRGAKASDASAFLTDPAARVLFPEFLAREYRYAEQMGRNELAIADIVAGRVAINSVSYVSEYLQEGQTAPHDEVAEGAHFPTLVLKSAEHSIKLKKYGGVLKLSYESMRRQRLDRLAVWVRKVALDARRAKVRTAVETLINGDGNGNAAPDRSLTSTGFVFGDLVDLVVDFKDGFEPSVLIGDKDTVIREVLKFDIFTARDSVAPGANFRDTGDWPRPLGKELKYVEGVTAIANKLLGVDRRYALEEIVEEGSELVESERLITTQFQNVVFSEVVGYAKIFTGASRTLTHA